jgi:hypothetical protein
VEQQLAARSSERQIPQFIEYDQIEAGLRIRCACILPRMCRS